MVNYFIASERVGSGIRDEARKSRGSFFDRRREPTLRFQVLYVFLVLAHDRRRILHCHVTAHPTAEWTGQQLREAFPFEQLPRYLLRDRDAIFGHDFREQVRDMGIREALSAPRSPWQRAYGERVIGSFFGANASIMSSCSRKARCDEPSIRISITITIENPSFVGEGLTGATNDSAAGNGIRGGRAAGRWTASPLRTTGCLKAARIHHTNPPEAAQNFR
jgi:transposase InsO family protein